MANEFDKLIDAMCMTWRHDFDLIIAEPHFLGRSKVRTAGMTETEREGLRAMMRQLLAHHGDEIARLATGIECALYHEFGALRLERNALRDELDAYRAHASDKFTE